MKSSVLELIGSVAIPAIERFTARDSMLFRTHYKAEVQIAYMCERFIESFLPKIEKPVQPTTLRFHDLKKRAINPLIIDELGGEGVVEIFLSQMFYLLKQQPIGEDGALCLGKDIRLFNIFFIRDINNELQSIVCYFEEGTWRISAEAITTWPSPHHIGCRVFSH